MPKILPENIDKIYNTGLGVMIVPDDPNIPMKNWKKIQNYMDKFWPNFSDETNEKIDK